MDGQPVRVSGGVSIIKVVKIDRTINQEVVESLEHLLKLAQMGEVLGVVGAARLKTGSCRKFVHGEYLDDIPKAMGELETVKMWLYGELELYDVPPREDELQEIQSEIEKE